MDLLDRETITSLASHRGWPSLSFYLPTHRLPRQQAEDRLRLKNLVRDACERLGTEGMRASDAEGFCAPVKAMLDDDTFWREMGEGLAVFISADGVRTLRLDVSLPEETKSGDRYYLRPLLAAYRPNESFFALALDKNGTRLFKGDLGGVEELPITGADLTFDESMKYEASTEPSMAIHSISAGHLASRHAGEGSSYAGHGGLKDADIGLTARFARQIERALQPLLVNRTEPLVLFGVERLVSAYRQSNTYPYLYGTHVGGSSDYLGLKEIHAGALEVLEPYLAHKVEEDLHDLTEREGSALVSHDVREIVSAAASGRVKTLFFDDSVGPFGVVDRDSLEVTRVCSGAPRFLRESAQADASDGVGDGDCGWDLIDLAAAETALHGGELHAFAGEDAPVSGVAAVFRY